jgi:hypothetical protein
VAITNGKLEGRVTIPTGGVQFATVTDDDDGPHAATIAAGDYYWSSADSGANDLPAQIEASITAALPGSGRVWVVTVQAAEGEAGTLTIANDGSTCTVTWNDTTFRDMCGYTGNLSGATSYLSPNHVEALWLPDGAPVSPYGLDDDGDDEPDWTSTESPAGHVKSLVYQRKTVQSIEWGNITHARCRVTGESTTNESFQKFYRDVILAEHTYCTGTPIRVYPDADTDATYTTYRVSGHVPKPEQIEDGYIGVWRISLPRLVKVP